MKATKWSLFLVLVMAASLALFAGCLGGDDGDADGDVDGDVDGDSDGDVADGDETPDGDATDGDATDGDAASGMVGDACAENTECATEFCLNTAVISTLTGNEIEIVNGYCSSLSPEICTVDVNGHNVSAAFLGEDYADFNICLSPCEVDDDCRPADSVICFDPSTLIEAGYLTEEQVATFFGEGKVCIPQAVLDAALETLSGEGGE
ncbi:MAG: hypothetical protein C4523_13205 [Myxococcales bacterium]|nr:MAG: hypothetical protein C4523_13205 [Myxococcales bacterium]